MTVATSEVRETGVGEEVISTTTSEPNNDRRFSPLVFVTAGAVVSLLLVIGTVLLALQSVLVGVAFGLLAGGLGYLAWSTVEAPRRAVQDPRAGSFASQVRSELDVAESLTLEMADGRELVIEAAGQGAPGAALPGGRQEGAVGHVRGAVLAGSPEIVAGAAAWADTIHASLALDESVTNALEQLSGQAVDGLADFRNAVEAKDYDLSSIKLRGHVGEQESARLFQEAGVDVQWPEGGATAFGPSNTPGFDFLLDGAPVNIKITNDAGRTVSEHFDKYPDIPAVVNEDAANIPSDALYSSSLDPSDLIGDHLVIVQEGLTLTGVAALQSAAEGAADSAADALPIPGLGMVVVAVTSGIREQRLVADGHKDASRALESVSIDVLTRGGGALVGAKAGGLAGAAVDGVTAGATLGLGAATGALVGAVGGGYAGSKVGARIKRRHLLRAQDELQHLLARYGQAAERERETAARRLDRVRAAQEQSFRSTAGQAERELREFIERQRPRIQAAAAIDRTRASMWADRARESALLDGASPRVAVVHWWAALQQHRRTRAWNLRLDRALEDFDRTGPQGCMDLVMASPAGPAIVGEYTDGINRQRADSLIAVQLAYTSTIDGMVQARAEAIRRVRTAEQDERARIKDALAPQAEKVSEGSAAVKAEIRALTGKAD